MVVATVLSVVVAWRTLLTASSSAFASQSRQTQTEAKEHDDELGRLIATLTAPTGPSGIDRSQMRDPLATYVAPKPTTRRTTTTPKPAAPSMKVLAVIVDDDPRAIVKVSGGSETVRLGDETPVGRVVRIESNGVTVDGSAGERTYPYPPR